MTENDEEEFCLKILWDIPIAKAIILGFIVAIIIHIIF